MELSGAHRRRRHPGCSGEQRSQHVHRVDTVLGGSGEVGPNCGQAIGALSRPERSGDLLVDYSAPGVMASKCRLSGGIFQPVHVALKAVDDSTVTGHLAVPSALRCIVSK